MPRIKVPAALTHGGSPTTVEVDGTTVREALAAHARTYGPELRESVVEDDELKEFINVFVDGEEVDTLDDAIQADALIRVIPAASGGVIR